MATNGEIAFAEFGHMIPGPGWLYPVLLGRITLASIKVNRSCV